jgi:iron complex outermembrane receptor protein
LAQTPEGAIVTGIVIEAGNKQPIAGAHIQLRDAHREAITGSDGRFRFAHIPAGRYALHVQRLAYQAAARDIELRGADTIRLVIEMNVVAIDVDQLVVTGTLGASTRHDLPKPVSVVSGAELDRRSDLTVAATIAHEAGVAISGIGPATARPVLRGLGGDRVLILEDGRRPGDLSSTSADHAVAIEPLGARRIEVVRGPLSLLYGSSALGGVVNVIRDEIPVSLPDHVHGALVTQAASVNEAVSGAGHAVVAVGPLAVRGEFSGRVSGDVRTPLGKLPNTGTETWNLGGGAALIGERGVAGAAYRYYRNDYGIPGGFVGGHAAGVDIEMRRHTVSGRAELHTPEDAFLSTPELNLGYTDYFHAERSSSGSVSTTFAQQLFSGEALVRHRELGRISEGAFGIRFQYRDIATGGSLHTPDTYDVSFASFLVEEMASAPWRIQAGARWDVARYKPREQTTIFVGGREIEVRPRNFGSFSGSLAVLYDAASDVRLGLSVGRAYRTPDFNELYSDGPHLAANSYDVGDPELRSENGLGADFFIRLSREQVRAEAGVFTNLIDNFIFPSSRGRIDTGPQEGRPRLQFTNEDVRFVGAEAELEWTVREHWIVELTASHVAARFTASRPDIPVLMDNDTVFIAASAYPPLIPPLNARLAVRYEEPRAFLGGELHAAAEQERLGDFEARTAGYTVASVFAGIRISHGGGLHAVTLHVDNLLDTSYREHLSRIKDIMPAPGRNFSLLYRWSF